MSDKSFRVWPQVTVSNGNGGQLPSCFPTMVQHELDWPLRPPWCSSLDWLSSARDCVCSPQNSSQPVLVLHYPPHTQNSNNPKGFTGISGTRRRAGELEREMKITSLGLPAVWPLWPHWQFVRHSILPKMADPLGQGSWGHCFRTNVVTASHCILYCCPLTETVQEWPVIFRDR